MSERAPSVLGEQTDRHLLRKSDLAISQAGETSSIRPKY